MSSERISPISILTKNHQKLASTFHGSRLKEIPENKLRSSGDPKITDLLTSNGDELFGPGVYTALEKSAQNYAEIRKGALYEVDITGKNFFDYRKLNALFAKKDGISKITKMLDSKNEKVREFAKNVLLEVKIISEAFILYLERKIKEKSQSQQFFIRRQANWLKLIKILNSKNVNSDNIEDLQSGIDLGESLPKETRDREHIQELALFHFGGFLQEFGFDGVIGLEIADWNWAKNGKRGTNLTYVVFDQNFEGVPAKKVA